MEIEELVYPQYFSVPGLPVPQPPTVILEPSRQVDPGSAVPIYSAGAPPNYQATVLADAPLGYWRLGEASGTVAADISGNGFNGIYTNCTLGTAGLLSGDPNAAVTFNGITSVVDLGVTAGLNITGVATVEAIIKMIGWPAANAQGAIYARAYSGGYEDGFLVETDAGGTVHSLFIYSYDGGTHSTTATISWALGEAHHVVGQYTGSAWKIFIDGVQVASTADVVGSVASTGHSSIGAEIGQPRFLNAVLDEVATYNTVLSAARILVHAQSAGYHA